MMSKRYIKYILIYALIWGLTLFLCIDDFMFASLHGWTVSWQNVFRWAVFLTVLPEAQDFLSRSKMPWQISIKKRPKRLFMLLNALTALGIAVLVLKGIETFPVWIYFVQFILFTVILFCHFESSWKQLPEVPK